MDLRTVTEWAGQAGSPGTPANAKIADGLGPLLPSDSSVTVRNPTSSRDNGVAPALTRVLLCDTTTPEGRKEFCVKLYPDSADGVSSMHRHESLLRELGDAIPVPRVIEAVPSGDRFGFPALITTVIGYPLDEKMHDVPADAGATIIADLGNAIATLHQYDLDNLSIEGDYDPGKLLNVWREDAAWYRDNAHTAQEYTDLVIEAAAILAAREEMPRHGRLIHRDLTPYNVVMVENRFGGIVDWDHAGIAAPQEDVAKAVIGLLIMSSVPYGQRLQIAGEFVRVYASAVRRSAFEFFEQCVPFALDTILDWIIGIKNAPRDELAWATRQILERNGI